MCNWPLVKIRDFSEKNEFWTFQVTEINGLTSHTSQNMHALELLHAYNHMLFYNLLYDVCFEDPLVIYHYIDIDDLVLQLILCHIWNLQTWKYNLTKFQSIVFSYSCSKIAPKQNGHKFHTIFLIYSIVAKFDT